MQQEIEKKTLKTKFFPVFLFGNENGRKIYVEILKESLFYVF